MNKKKVNIRFYSYLKNLLPKNKKDLFFFDIKPGQTVKDLIESLGIPHTEINLILVNSKIEDFSYQMNDNDRISVYPKFYHIDINSINKLDSDIPDEFKFIADVHLGKLAKDLRMLGFDCIWKNDFQDKEIIDFAINSNRIILTRDKGILKHAKIKYGYLIKSHQHYDQLLEIVERYDLIDKFSPFSRCMECNTPTNLIEKNKIIDRLEPKTKKYFDTFRICPNCDKIYWNGSHSERMNKIIEKIKNKFLNQGSV